MAWFFSVVGLVVVVILVVRGLKGPGIDPITFYTLLAWDDDDSRDDDF
jgi:hypothetical protein